MKYTLINYRWKGVPPTYNTNDHKKDRAQEETMLIAYMQFVYVLLGRCIILLQNQLLLAIWHACSGPKKYDQCNTGATGQLLIPVDIALLLLHCMQLCHLISGKLAQFPIDSPCTLLLAVGWKRVFSVAVSGQK